MKFNRFLDPIHTQPPSSNPDHKRCSACQLEKPIRDFVRTASLPQSRAWLKNPASQKRLRYEGKICNACHNAKHHSPRDLQPEAYRKRLVNEGVHPAKIDALVKARRQRGSKTRAEKTKTARLARALPKLALLLADLRLTENKLKNKRTHLRRIDLADSPAGVFCAQYAFMLDAVKARLRGRAKTGARLPDRWQGLITNAEAGELRDAYQQIPTEYNQRFAQLMLALPDAKIVGDTCPQPDG